MRGIERVLAAIALMAALGGTAAVARHMAGDTTDAQPVSLAAPPRQHVPAPRPVWAPLPPRIRTLSRPALAAVPTASAPASTPTPVRRIVVPRVTPPQPRSPTPQAKPDPPAPAPAPTPAPAPAPVIPAPGTPRVLASVTPQDTTLGEDGGSDEGDGHHGGGHGHEDGHSDDQGSEGDQGGNGHDDHGHHGDHSDD